MTIKIPTNKSITVRQYIAWKKAKDDIERMIVITGWSPKQISGLKPETIDTAITLFTDSIEDKSGEFVRMFDVRKKFKRKRLAIIPNFESMTFAEYISTDEMVREVFEKKKWDKLPDLLCVLYRPVKNKLGDWYTLEKYDTDKVEYYREHIMELSLYQINGLLAFFLTFAIELSKASTQSLTEKMTKIQSLSEIPDLVHSDGSI